MNFSGHIWPSWALGVLIFVIASRLVELVYARRNTARLLAEGGREHFPRHYPFFILLHGSWLLAILLAARPAATPPAVWLVLFVLSQLARFWTLASIGRWWTTRIVSAPHFPRIQKGPYRFLSHPNYFVVISEIATLPLLLGAPVVAAVWSALNAALLVHRVSLEERVLAERGRE